MPEQKSEDTMKLKETFERRGVWELVYVVAFYIPIWAAISSAFENSVEMIPLVVIGLIIGSAAGLGIYRLVRSKSHLTKSLVVIGVMIVVSLIAGQIETYSKDARYDPCEICGFISVDKKTHKCEICASEQWDESMTGEQFSREDYLREEQLFWFNVESSDEKVDFNLPLGERNDENFSKNKNWKPLVTEMEVLEYSKKRLGE